MNRKAKIGITVAIGVVLAVTAGVVVGRLTAPVPAPVAQGNATTQPDNKTYYWVAANNSNPFYAPGLEGWNKAATELGVKTQFVGPSDPNLAEQIKIIEQITADPNTAGFFLYAMDFNAAEPIIKEAEAKGVRVVIGNTDSPFKTRSAFVGTDNSAFGFAAAEYAAKAIDCKGQVGAIANTGAGVIARMEAFRKHIKELCPDVDVLEGGTFDGSVQQAETLLDSYTAAHPDMTLLWWTEGAAGQMVQPWKEKQQAGVKTLFLATDIPEATLAAVKDGTFVATMGQDTFSEEYVGLKTLYDVVHGNPVADSAFPKTLVITKDNVDKYITKK